MFDEKNHEFYPGWHEPETNVPFEDDTPRDHHLPHSYKPGREVGPIPPAHVPIDPAFTVPPIPPLRPPVGYITPEEQVKRLNGKMNELIDTLNGYNHKVFGAYEAVVNSALYNDAYYSEITVEDGYLSETSSPYKVVHIPFVDRANRPIFLELGLAYNNTTNSGVKESIFSASSRTLADKIIPAVNTGANLYGVGTWKYAPIPASEVMPIDGEDTRKHKFSLGISTNGFMQVYAEIDGVRELMNRNQVRNSIGVLSVLIKEHEKSADLYGDEETAARVGIGMNYHTKERFIVIVDDSPVPAQGCTCDQLAEIFKRYGCHVAVEVANNTSVTAMDKGEFMFYPESADSPVIPSIPDVMAFWYITKRRTYRNQYVKEIAELMQRVGQNEWSNKTANFTVDYLKGEVTKLTDSLNTEIDERGKGDVQLNKKIDEEIVTLNERIDQEVKTLEAEDANIKNYFTVAIQNEQAAREAEDTKINAAITAEEQARQEKDTALENADIDRVKQVEDREHVVEYTLIRKDASEVNQHIKSYEPETLKQKIVSEVQMAVDGTKDTYTLINDKGEPINHTIDVYDYDKLVSKLSTLDAKDTDNEAAIQQEAQTRATEDTRLSGRIDTNDSDIATLKQQVGDISGAVSDSSDKNAEQDRRLSALETDFNELESSTQEKLAQFDTTVSGLQNTVASNEASQEQTKQLVNNLQQEMNTFESRIDESVTNLTNKVDQLDTRENEDMQSLSQQLQGVAQNANDAKQGVKANSERITYVNEQLTQKMEEADNEIKQTVESYRDILQKLIDTTSDNLHTLEDTVQGEISNRQSEDSKLSDRIDTNVSDIEQLKQQSGDLSNTLSSYDERLSELDTRENEDMQLLSQQLQGVAKNAADAKNGVNANSERITHVNDTLTQQMEEADKEIKQTVESYRDILQKLIDTTSDSLHALEKTVEQIQSTVDSGNFPEIKDKLSELETKFNDYLPLSGGTMTGKINFERSE